MKKVVKIRNREEKLNIICMYYWILCEIFAQEITDKDSQYIIMGRTMGLVHYDNGDVRCSFL